MADIILRTSNLNKTYRGKVDTPVLFDINIEIARGSFTALIGPSGSGKSTLLNCLGLLDPQTSGEIDFDGRIITSQNVNELAGFRNANIGFIFQFHYLLPGIHRLRECAAALLDTAGQTRARDRPAKPCASWSASAWPG